jgi:hypothetical protein
MRKQLPEIVLWAFMTVSPWQGKGVRLRARKGRGLFARGMDRGRKKSCNPHDYQRSRLSLTTSISLSRSIGLAI